MSGGFIGFIVVAMLFGAIIAVWSAANDGRHARRHGTNSPGKLLTKEPDLPYEPRRYLLTIAERSFHGVLERAVGDQYKVMAKVRVADVIRPQRGLDASARQTALNRIQSKHVDFVLCDPRDMSIVCAIDLDDKSHNRPKTQARDALVDGALDAAGIRILRFPVRSGYDVQEIRTVIVG